MSHPRNLPWPAEVRARAMKLRGLGLVYREIEELTGVPKGTLCAWQNDPDRARNRALKESYRGTCEWCGRPTTGCNGPDKAPTACRECWPHLNRIWTRETVLAAILRFAERHGRQPTATDFMAGPYSPEQRERFYADGDYPHQNSVHEVFGSWRAAIEAAGFRTATGRYVVNPRPADREALDV